MLEMTGAEARESAALKLRLGGLLMLFFSASVLLMEWRYIVVAAFFLLGLWHRGGREEVQCYIFSVALIFLTVFTFIMEDF